MAAVSSPALWTSVDHYLNDRLVEGTTGIDEALAAALKVSAAEGLPAIAVAPNQGKALMLLAMACRAKHILEVGTLGGYSTIWLARALAVGGAPSGSSERAPTLVTLEVDPHHAAVARANIDRAGFSAMIDLRVGRAIDTLPVLHQEVTSGRRPAFDLTFIDADKPSTPDYFAWALRLSRPGSLIVVDNVIRDGEVADAASSDASVQGIRRTIDAIASNPKVTATAIQTVGTKGYDGFLLAAVL